MVTVSYHCPRCGAIAELERGAYLADKCVTAEPLDGWEYANAYDGLAERRETDGAGAEPRDPPAYRDADGVVLVCGAAETEGEGCGEPYYLNFVKFDDGDEVDPGLPVEGARFDFRT